MFWEVFFKSGSLLFSYRLFGMWAQQPVSVWSMKTAENGTRPWRNNEEEACGHREMIVMVLGCPYIYLSHCSELSMALFWHLMLIISY